MSKRLRAERPWTRAVFLIVLVIAVGSGLWHWREALWALFGSQQRIREWVLQFGPWGPVVSVALNTAQVLLAPVPGQFVGLANGFLYGVWRGTLYSMMGLLMGTALAMGIGRWFGRPLIERLVKPAQLDRWDRIAGRQGPLFFFFIFLLPFLPDDIVCFVIGLSPASIPRMLVLAALGRLPGVFVSCWVGSRATALPWWAWVILGGGSVGLAWLFWRYQSRLEYDALHVVRRLTGRKVSGSRAESAASKTRPSARPCASCPPDGMIQNPE